MQKPTELVDELVRGLLPAPHGMLMITDIERRAEEFGAAALKAEPDSPHRAIAASCSDYLNRLHRSLAATAWRS